VDKFDQLIVSSSGLQRIVRDIALFRGRAQISQHLVDAACVCRAAIKLTERFLKFGLGLALFGE
ncbi:MAG: hypothetical protein ACKVQS_03105, partial [Fimbriimonadaceae bacterium]